ncbi:MAG: type VI secretion system Vgr family protein [Gemmataceae bacterium]
MFESLLNKPLAVHTPLGPDALLLTGFQGSTALSELYRFELDLLATTPGIASFDKLLGQPATVRILQVDGSPVYFHGLIGRLEQVAQDRKHVHYRAWLLPRLWLLTRKIQSRIFQQQSVLEILQAVLEPLRPDVDMKLQKREEYAPRDYCVQYRESDFAFASRLMEEEGIYYYFEHSDKGHKLILTDSHALLPAPPGLELLQYDEGNASNTDTVRVRSWQKRQDLCSSNFTCWDQSFELSNRKGHGFQTLEAKKRIVEKVKAGQVEHSFDLGASRDLEVYECSGGYAKDFDSIDPDGDSHPEQLSGVYEAAVRRVTRRAEAEAVTALNIGGQSNCALLTPGHKFRLAAPLEHAGQYYVTRVTHEAQASEDRSGAPTAFTYANRFECLPVDLPFRPLQTTPRPNMQGVQTATVVGASAGETNVPPHLDKYGRVKVQFHWDRARKFDGHSSCWLRVGQIWAGPRWGAFFWPRPGHEVIVAFEEGDPDRPIITGSVYNSVNMPPLELPGELHSCGIKSCTAAGDPLKEFNCVIFRDHPGRELLQIHSEIHEGCSSNGSHVIDCPGPYLGSYGTLTFPTGSGSGSGHDNKDSAAEETEKKQLEKEQKEAKYWRDWSKLPGFLKNFGKALNASEKTQTVLGAIGSVLNWKSGAKSSLQKIAGGMFPGLAFPSRTEMSCGDATEYNLWGKKTDYLIWGGEQNYIMEDPIELIEGSVVKKTMKMNKIAEKVYKYAMMGVKLGPEPSGNFEMLIGKKTEFNYYGPFTDVKRGDKYEWESEDFSLLAKEPYDKAMWALAAGVYLATSATAILGRLFNKLDHEGEVEVEHLAFIIANVVGTKLAGILYEFEADKAKVEAGKEKKEQTTAEKDLAQKWGLDGIELKSPAAVKLGIDHAKEALQRVDDLAKVLGDITGITDPVNSAGWSRRHHNYNSSHSISANELTFAARAPVGSTDGNITVQARGTTSLIGAGGAGGKVTIIGGKIGDDAPAGGSISLQTAGNQILMHNAADAKQILIANASPGAILLGQRDSVGFATGPALVLQSEPGDNHLQMSVGLPLQGAEMKLTSDKISLILGPPQGGTVVQLMPDALKLAMGGSSITLSADEIKFSGPNIKIDALAQLELQALKMKESAQALAERVAALEKVG